MYRLVEFTDTSCLNIIPDDWYDNGITWWPNYKNEQKINSAIQRREKPRSDWACFAVRELSKAGSPTAEPYYGILFIDAVSNCNAKTFPSVFRLIPRSKNEIEEGHDLQSNRPPKRGRR